MDEPGGRSAAPPDFDGIVGPENLDLAIDILGALSKQLGALPGDAKEASVMIAYIEMIRLFLREYALTIADGDESNAGLLRALNADWLRH